MLFIGDILVSTYLGMNVGYLIYLIATKQLFHHIEKRSLVKGDLVIIRFRGKYRKAYVKEVGWYQANKVQLEFDDKSLNTKFLEHNWYPLSRIILPEYMGKMAKVLFSELEKK
jgi:hypothetical protein